MRGVLTAPPAASHTAANSTTTPYICAIKSRKSHNLIMYLYIVYCIVLYTQYVCGFFSHHSSPTTVFSYIYYMFSKTMKMSKRAGFTPHSVFFGLVVLFSGVYFIWGGTF
jgi:hypothetical protein